MHALLDLLVPPRCAVCRLAGPLLCAACLSELPLLDGSLCARCGLPAERPVDDCASCRGRRVGFESAAAALLFEGAARDLVHALKDGGLRGLAVPAAALMALVLGRPAVDVVTWVPADPLREAMRGYHPARLLAEQLAKRWDVPARPLLRAPLGRCCAHRCGAGRSAG